MTGRSRAVVVAMMLWWAVFGCISVSWALGSPWLVDTVLQGEGLRLAHERPTWFIVVVLVSGLVKLGFVVFGFALLRPDVIRVPRWMRLAFGWVSGVLLMAYGIAGSVPAIPTILSGEPLSRYGWWRLVLWMPHFWVGGILVLAIVRIQRPDGTWSSRSWETYRYAADPITSPEEFAGVIRTALCPPPLLLPPHSHPATSIIHRFER